MSAKIKKYAIVTFGILVVAYPLWERYRNLNWAFDNTLLGNLFPMFGLAAFSVMWLHVVGGVFKPWLEKYIDFEKFVDNSALAVLAFIILHPLLLFASLGFKNAGDVIFYGAKYIWLAIFGWVLLMTYDIGKVFKEKKFFIRHWEKILFLSTVGLLFIFFHSLGIGSDLQAGPLRVVWIFYGTTAIIATVYTFVIKKFIERNRAT